MQPGRRNDLNERLLNYAVRIIRPVHALPGSPAGRTIGNQLLRSGTSPGANYEESQGAESQADFVHKLHIALKELRESDYLLRVIARSGLLPNEMLPRLLDESGQLKAILSKSVATAKGKARPKPVERG